MAPMTKKIQLAKEVHKVPIAASFPNKTSWTSDDGSVAVTGKVANTLKILLNIGFDIEFKIPFQSRRQLTLFDDSMMMMDRIELGIRIRNHQIFNQNKS